MQIEGIQKLTLLDYPGQVACTVFTPGCDFRCPFCHNARLVVDAPAEGAEDIEAFFAFLEKRRGVLDGVAVTGGEPLLQEGVGAFLARIKQMGYLVKLDTNGSYPEKLQELAAQKCFDYLAVDIKNSPAKYPQTAGCSEALLEKVRETVAWLKTAPVEYEFRTTVVDEFHEEDDFRAMGEWIRGASRWYLQKFEDSGELIRQGLHAAGKEQMQRYLAVAREYVSGAQLRGM